MAMRLMDKAKWKDVEGQYSTGRVLFLGSFRVGSAGFDGCTSKDSNKSYSARCRLPGIKDHLGHFETQEQAEKTVWGAVAHWLKKAVGE
jgi:hypothetical protein